ncbi:MAG TPA: hypothetical protein VLM76_11265 [Patescibacteria group bacterium]|nr:hypothetical protein [Patescibacteria group bacterium]
MTPDPHRELALLRQRIADIEREAARIAAASLADAVTASYNRPRPAPRFVPDASFEAALAARAKDPRGYDREMRRVGADRALLELSIYETNRRAAVKAGTFVPPAEGDTR